MLFATQHPPGVYGGRKVLSRAFRNRFLELHVGDIPDEELVTILQQRCQVRCARCVAFLSVLFCFWRCVWEVRRQFFPQMIDSDSKMAVRASPLERFNLASISDPTHTPGPTAASAFRRPAAIPPLTPPFQTQIPPSYCVKLVEVMRELQRRRQGSAVFAGKDGFITARDLLR